MATRNQKKWGIRIARKWVNFKLKAEQPFKRELKSYFFGQYKRIKRGQDPLTIANYLDHQYKRIIRNMTGIVFKQEDFRLKNSLSNYLLGLAASRSQRIDRTTTKYLNRSEVLARQELASEGIIFPAQSVLNKTTANIFRGMNRGRVGNIAVSETQAITEGARNITFSVADDMMRDAIFEQDPVLADEAANISDSLTHREIADDIGKEDNADLFARLALLFKMWVTMGDKKVREAHNKAAWQVVATSEPFVVDGELLMYPGDDSLGATAKNLANCRCVKVGL